MDAADAGGAASLLATRRPCRNAILYGFCVLMNGLTNIHQFLFGTTALVLSIVLLALLATRFKWRTLIGAAGATILAAALMVPVLLPYKQVSEQYGMVRDRNTAMWGSATWTDWLSATGRSRAYGEIADPKNVQREKVLFPGLMMLFLTASALPDRSPQTPGGARRPPRSAMAAASSRRRHRHHGRRHLPRHGLGAIPMAALRPDHHQHITTPICRWSS